VDCLSGLHLSVRDSNNIRRSHNAPPWYQSRSSSAQGSPSHYRLLLCGSVHSRMPFAYVLMQLVILSRKLAVYEESLWSSVANAYERLGYRYRLGASPFVQYLSGFDSGSNTALQVMVGVFVLATIIVLPVIILILSLLTILPYHDPVVLWINRACIVTVLTLLAVFGPSLRGPSEKIVRNRLVWLPVI
jgi:hypothetical protein